MIFPDHAATAELLDICRDSMPALYLNIFECTGYRVNKRVWSQFRPCN
jgi:hypothetical protein